MFGLDDTFQREVKTFVSHSSLVSHWADSVHCTIFWHTCQAM